jgi:hypothetical protein
MVFSVCYVIVFPSLVQKLEYCIDNWSFMESLLTQRIFLILYSTVVTRCTARFNIQKLCILPTECI